MILYRQNLLNYLLTARTPQYCFLEISGYKTLKGSRSHCVSVVFSFFASGKLGALRLKVRLVEDRILPSVYYQPLIHLLVESVISPTEVRIAVVILVVDLHLTHCVLASGNRKTTVFVLAVIHDPRSPLPRWRIAVL